MDVAYGGGVADDGICSKRYTGAFAGHVARPVASHERLPRHLSLGNEIALLAPWCGSDGRVLIWMSVTMSHIHTFTSDHVL